MRSKSGIMLSVALIAAGALAVWAAIAMWQPGAGSKLTLHDAERKVLSQYSGTITEIIPQGPAYIIRLKSEQGLYELTVEGEPAEIIGIRSLETYPSEGPAATNTPLPTGEDPGTASPSPTPSPSSGTGTEAPASNPSPSTAPTKAPTGKPSSTPGPSSPSAKPTSNPAILISEEEAIALALKKVPGTVKDVDRENEGGRWYYFVEIETKDGREADVQLNAASGAIVSVTWDDDDDDD
ncbi:PepSY domain-containing protein [Paenibacillus sp. CAU 1782]